LTSAEIAAAREPLAAAATGVVAVVVKVEANRPDGGGLPLNSVTMRSASFLPTPFARLMAAVSLSAMASISCAVVSVSSRASAILAPTPGASCRRANHARSSAETKPNRRMALSDICVSTNISAASPTASFASVREPACTR